ncbi:hypothetical protein D3C77_665450 [compost metagenome]
MLTQANWEARRGGHYFVNIDADTFRVPDLRDMFRRFTGTDADTANARNLGSLQHDQFRSHAHTYNGTALVGIAAGSGVNIYGNFSGTTSTAGGAETRPVNVAYLPRIHA